MICVDTSTFFSLEDGMYVCGQPSREMGANSLAEIFSGAGFDDLSALVRPSDRQSIGCDDRCAYISRGVVSE